MRCAILLLIVFVAGCSKPAAPPVPQAAAAPAPAPVPATPAPPAEEPIRITYTEARRILYDETEVLGHKISRVNLEQDNLDLFDNPDKKPIYLPRHGTREQAVEATEAAKAAFANQQKRVAKAKELVQKLSPNLD